MFTPGRIVAPEIARLGVQDATAERHRLLSRLPSVAASEITLLDL